MISVERRGNIYSVIVELGKTTYEFTGARDAVLFHYSYILDTRRMAELGRALDESVRPPRKGDRVH